MLLGQLELPIEWGEQPSPDDATFYERMERVEENPRRIPSPIIPKSAHITEIIGTPLPEQESLFYSQLPFEVLSVSDPTPKKYENDILVDREKQWGDPVMMHGKIAKIWSGIFGIEVEDWQVALAMIGMKLARSSRNPSEKDTHTDIQGYTEIFKLLIEEKLRDERLED